MLGSIIGDIVGSIYEFRNIKTKDFPFWGYGASYTDDSILTIATANWLLLGGTCEEHYVFFGQQFPYPMGGYGGGFEKWLFAPSKLGEYDENGLLLSKQQCRHPYNSCGNGSAMRVGPVGWAFETEEEVLAAAKVSAECTHNHPEGIKGAQATALCILLGRKNVSKSIIRESIENKFGYNLNYTVEELRARYSWKGMDGLGNGGTCQDSVPQAIICALDALSFEDAVRNAISIGGDSDTIGCITGSIAEALYGIPQQIRDTAITYLPKSLVDVIESFEKKYSNKTEVANCMKFQECFQCRRANSHVCRDCQKAKHFLSNDTRKFYYINIEDAPRQGPVEAFLLPYKEVQIDSYVWTEGMKQWDFAGNVLDRRTLAVEFDFCPCCNGEFERHDQYPYDEETIVYKCKNCGFCFNCGGVRPQSELQFKYVMEYYSHMNNKYASEERNDLKENDKHNKHKYSAILYGPPPPRTNETPIPSSKYKRTKIMGDDSMRSTIYGTPAVRPKAMMYSPPPTTINPRPVVYGPPISTGGGFRIGCVVLTIIILLVLILFAVSYFIID